MNELLMEEVYRDQAPMCAWPISTFYTPEGIRRLDARLCGRIQAFKRGEEYLEYAWSYGHGYGKPPKREVEYQFRDTLKSLEKDIKKCPHLHEVIKKNLLFNLHQT